jgi:electron transfer flavoprotein-quinone oxidoreductase
MPEKVQTIVVGAGPAGSAAAYVLAKTGHEVMLVDRAQKPGEKNVSGCLLNGSVLEKLIPNVWEISPVERHVNKHRVSFLSGDSATTLEYSSGDSFASDNSTYTINRSKFDRWFSQMAEDAGALLVEGVLVEGVIEDDQRVIGIRSDGEEVHADVVIAADGVNSMVATDAGLKGTLEPSEMGLGVKEVYSLPREIIEERFGLQGSQGVAHSFLGCTLGEAGGGFLYTNLNTISLGSVAHLSGFESGRLEAPELVTPLKSHPLVRRMIAGGELIEYSAHLVSEAGYSGMPKLYDDGIIVVGDAAGLVLNLGYAFEGMNYAISSGIAAAQTVRNAVSAEDFSKSQLSSYRHHLEKWGIIGNLKRFKHAPGFLSNPRLHTEYAETINAIARNTFKGEGQRKKMLQLATHEMFSRVPLPYIMKDLLEALRAL